MTFWEWIGASVLGLQATVLLWLIKDYLRFRIGVVPGLITEQKYERCQSDMRRDLAEIKRHLEEDREQFQQIAVTLSRLCTILEVRGPVLGRAAR
jgi:hypothetical protein